MDAGFVEALLRLFERGTAAELDFTDANGDRLRLVRAAGAAPAMPAAPTAAPTAAPAPAAAAPSDAPPAGPAPETVAASVHGVFYRGPGPGQPPFVRAGDTVAEGQTLAILEAMKVLNKVEAPRPGRVAAVLAEDGATVAPGTPLFALDPVLPEPGP